jgi:hypothetical protein
MGAFQNRKKVISYGNFDLAVWKPELHFISTCEVEAVKK